MPVVDSPVADKFVPAPDNWSRNGGAIRAIVIHMAEGGGTVSWLTRPDGNSSHYVVEYDGTCTQMVLESRAAGSMNPKTTRTTNDLPYTYLGQVVRYGVTVLRAAGIQADPNRYSIAIETEGFASTGPNAKQRVTLAKLVNDIRKRRGPLPVLGHRDQQSYKACPGKMIPWVDYGGHGIKSGTVTPPKPQPEPPGDIMQGFAVPEQETLATLKEDASRPGNSLWLYSTSECKPDGKETSLSPIRPLRLIVVSPEVYGLAYEPDAPDPNSTSLVMFCPVTSIASTEPVPPPVDTTEAFKAGRLEALDEMHVAEMAARGV